MGKQVQIGEDQVTIQEFSGFKALEVMARVKGIMRAGPELQDEIAKYIRDYERDNVVELDRATARHLYGQQLDHLTDKDWEASGQKLRRPRSPGGYELAMHAFPIAFDIAKDETTKLIALLILTNRQLEEADDADNVEDVIAARAKKLLHEARADQLVMIAATCSELIEEQFDETVKKAAEPLGKVARFLGLKIPGLQTAEPDETPKTEPESQPEPSSSTNSPAPTDGTSEPSSTAPVGVGSPNSDT